MDFSIKTGTIGTETTIVEPKQTAKQMGSGTLNVLSSPALTAIMEGTAYRSIEDQLPEGFTTVGIQMNLAHKRASKPGEVITCTSEVTKFEGRKVFFSITASDSHGEVGAAEHIRYIVNAKEFLGRI